MAVDMVSFPFLNPLSMLSDRKLGGSRYGGGYAPSSDGGIYGDSYGNPGAAKGPSNWW